MRANLDNWLEENKPSGKKQQFEIRTHDGKVTVSGIVYNDVLAIEAGTNKVTHVPSGYVLDDYMTATRARQGVAFLLQYPGLASLDTAITPRDFQRFLRAISRFLTYQSNDDAEQRLIAGFCGIPDDTTSIRTVNGTIKLQNVSKGAFGAWCVRYLARGQACQRSILDANDRQIKVRKPIGQEVLTTVESIVGWALTQAEETQVLDLKTIV